MKPQLTVLIPLAGLSAYLIFKPSKKEVEKEENKWELHSEGQLESDSTIADSLQINKIKTTAAPKKE